MANTLTLPSGYIDLLDEVYVRSSVTADLTSPPELARAGKNVNEICYPQISVTGLGDYDRNSGYTQGAVDLKWKTTEYNYDRGTKISVDAMDEQESFNGECRRTIFCVMKFLLFSGSVQKHLTKTLLHRLSSADMSAINPRRIQLQATTGLLLMI